MSVSPTSKTLNIGETVQLTGTKNPTSTSEGTQWTSSNTGVATVSGSGLVTAKAAGTATITFKNSSSTKSASCTITVIQKYSSSEINSSFYGKLVSNYHGPNDNGMKYRIFYADGTNVYLIADDYIHYTKAPLPSDCTWVTSLPWNLSLKGKIETNYFGACPGPSYYKSYLASKKLWNNFYKGDNADWAQGAPSLDMYLSSYNETHNTNISYKIEYSSNYDLYIQEIIYNNNSTKYSLPMVEDYNGIYIKLDTSKAECMMIAEETGQKSFDSYLVAVGKRANNGLGSVPCIGTFSQAGSRPIVCLNSKTILHRNTDGSFSIAY